MLCEIMACTHVVIETEWPKPAFVFSFVASLLRPPIVKCLQAPLLFK